MEQEGSRRNVRRRIQLTSTARWQVAAIGAVAGMAMGGIGLRPTGSAPFDLVVLAITGAFVAWGACTAPWWMLVVASTFATAINPLGIGTAAGLLAIALSTWVGIQRRSKPLERATAAALIMVSLSFAGNLLMFGVSTAIGVVLMFVLVVAGLRRRPRSDRRLARRIVGGAFAFVVVVLAIAGLSGYRARNNLRAANQHATRGLNAMRSAEFETAATEFNAAAAQFEQADRKLAAPWVQPIRFIPVAAQQWRAADNITGTATSASLVVSTNANTVDLDRLRFKDGQIDVEAIRQLEAPLNEVRLALTELDAAVQESDSAWLAPQLADQLAELGTDIRKQQRLGDNALEAVKLAPAILGADGPRRYFLMFTTPAEARGQGGLMGSYAELTITNGKIDVGEVERTVNLTQSMENPVILQNAPADWMATWGPYGFKSGDDHHVSIGAWSNANMSAHFPNTAQVIAEMYTQSGGDEVDGVFSIDVYGIEALVNLVGPVEVDGAPTLTGENAAQFLLLDQYLDLPDEDIGDTNAERRDMLDDVADEVIERLLTSNPPDPLQLGRAFVPLAKQRRVLAWSPLTTEESLFEQIDVDGGVIHPAADSVDGSTTRPLVHLAVNNAGGNKIDSFLEQTVSTNGNEVSIVLENGAPKSGLPKYIIGSIADPPIPTGTNRMLLTIYSTVEVSNLTLNGEPLSVAAGSEAGTIVHTFLVDIAPGGTAELRMKVMGENPIVIEPPLARSAGVANEPNG